MHVKAKYYVHYKKCYVLRRLFLLFYHYFRYYIKYIQLKRRYFYTSFTDFYL